MPPSPPEIDALYRRHGGVVLRRIRRFYRDPVESEDVLQEVFVRVMDKIGTFRGDSSMTTWLYQLTTRHCLNRLRNEGRRRELLLLEGGVDWSLPTREASQEREVLFRSLWKVLDEDLVEIGIYYHLDGMTHDEISRIIGVSRRTVGNRLAELETRAKAAGGVS